MTPADILSHVDHTLLKPEATAADIEALCSEAAALFGCISLCQSPVRFPLCRAFGRQNPCLHRDRLSAWGIGRRCQGL